MQEGGEEGEALVSFKFAHSSICHQQEESSKVISRCLLLNLAKERVNQKLVCLKFCKLQDYIMCFACLSKQEGGRHCGDGVKTRYLRVVGYPRNWAKTCNNAAAAILWSSRAIYILYSAHKLLSALVGTFQEQRVHSVWRRRRRKRRISFPFVLFVLSSSTLPSCLPIIRFPNTIQRLGLPTV